MAQENGTEKIEKKIRENEWRIKRKFTKDNNEK